MVIVPSATQSQLFNDFSRKYREQFLPVNVGGQNCLQSFFAGQGNYTAYDNHELGNKQYINGGAPAGGGVGSLTGNPPFDSPTGAGVDARNSANDVTPNDGSVPFMNKSGGFQTLQQVYLNYQPVKDRGVLNVPSDPRTNGTRQLFFAQQWGRNVIFVNTDDRTYRDIRMKTAANADDTGFYSPDTFNYNVLEVSEDGKKLTVTSYGINSTVQNGFIEYDPVNNPEQELFSFRRRQPTRLVA